MPEKLVYLGELYLACSHEQSFPRTAAPGRGAAVVKRRTLRRQIGLPQVMCAMARGV